MSIDLTYDSCEVNGVHVDFVRVECDKLKIRIDRCFEAVFALEFDLPQEFFVPDEEGRMRTQYPVLLLYDFVLLVEGLEDSYLAYGSEFEPSKAVKLTKI